MEGYRLRCVIWVLFHLLSFIEILNSHINWKESKPKYCWGDEEYDLEFKEQSPIEVSVRLKIMNLFDVNEAKMEYKLLLVKSMLWKDPILDADKFNVTDPEVIPENFSKCLWKPDTSFQMCKRIQLYVKDHQPTALFKIVRGGLIYFYSWYILDVSCNMEFQYYPMDTQICPLEIFFLYSRDGIAKLRWMSDTPIGRTQRNLKNLAIKETVAPLQFYLKEPISDYYNKTTNSGNTSNLICTFKFVRYLTGSVINMYIPSSLVVCLSFVSFWLDVDAVPGRVTLGVTALLTLATQMHSSRSSLPSVNYMTAQDVWLLGCLVFVFLSLVEFIVANSSARQGHNIIKPEEPRSQSLENINGWINKSKLNLESDNKEPAKRQNTRTRTTKPGKINFDSISKIVFPILLVLFALIYWMFYLIKSGRL